MSVCAACIGLPSIPPTSKTSNNCATAEIAPSTSARAMFGGAAWEYGFSTTLRNSLTRSMTPARQPFAECVLNQLSVADNSLSVSKWRGSVLNASGIHQHHACLDPVLEVDCHSTFCLKAYSCSETTGLGALRKRSASAMVSIPVGAVRLGKAKLYPLQLSRHIHKQASILADGPLLAECLACGLPTGCSWVRKSALVRRRGLAPSGLCDLGYSQTGATLV